MNALLRPHRTRIFRPGDGPETRAQARWISGTLRFEFIFISPVCLIGNARHGWSDVSGRSEQFIEWSDTGDPDGHWLRGQFEASDSPETLRADGRYEYRALSIHPLSGTGSKCSQYARLGVHTLKNHRNFQ